MRGVKGDAGGVSRVVGNREPLGVVGHTGTGVGECPFTLDDDGPNGSRGDVNIIMNDLEVLFLR